MKKRNRNLYEYFDCGSKEELYEKMKSNHPSVKDLKSFYNKHSFVKNKIGPTRFQRDLVEQVTSNNLLPIEGTYTALGINTQNEIISSVCFTEEESFKNVLSKISSKGFKSVVLIENNASKDKEIFDSKFNKEFELMNVPILDSFKIIKNDYDNNYKMSSIIYQSSEEYLIKHDELCFEEPNLKYLHRENKINDLKHYDEFSYHYAEENLLGLNLFKDKEEIKDLLIIGNSGFRNEVLQLLSFDKDYNIEGISVESIGSVSTTLADPLSISNTLLDVSKGFIVIHNHPSGNTEPSEADLDMTERFESISKIMELDMYDHYIIGEENVLSLREELSNIFNTMNDYYHNAEKNYNSDSQLSLFDKGENLIINNINQDKQIAIQSEELEL